MCGHVLAHSGHFAVGRLTGYTGHIMRWDIGAYRERIRRRIKRLQKIKTWQLVIVLLLGSLVALTLLRLNNLGMIDRLTAVQQADTEGDPEKIKQAITELGQYVTRHMNTDIGDKLYLTHSYERDKEAAVAAAQSTTNPNSAEYQAASIECRARWQGNVASFRNDYVKCVIDRVAALSGQSTESLSATMPNAEVYRVAFASPLWSPDLAGVAVAFCAVIMGSILFRITGMIVLQVLLRRQFTSV